MKKQLCFIFLLVFAISFVSAQGLVPPELPINGSTLNTNHSNSTDNLLTSEGAVNDFNWTQFFLSGGVVGLNETWLNITGNYVQVAGDTMTGTLENLADVDVYGRFGLKRSNKWRYGIEYNGTGSFLIRQIYDYSDVLTNAVRFKIEDDGNINISENISADYFKGDGSELTNLPSFNPFDQSLNTTDNVKFNSLNVSSTTSIESLVVGYDSWTPSAPLHIFSGEPNLMTYQGWNTSADNYTIKYIQANAGGSPMERVRVVIDREDTTQLLGSITWHTITGVMTPIFQLKHGGVGTFFGDRFNISVDAFVGQDLYVYDDLEVTDELTVGGDANFATYVNLNNTALGDGDYGFCHENTGTEMCTYVENGLAYFGTKTNDPWCVYVNNGGCALEVEADEDVRVYDDLQVDGGLTVDEGATIYNPSQFVVTHARTGTTGLSSYLYQTPTSGGVLQSRAQTNIGRNAASGAAGYWALLTNDGAGLTQKIMCRSGRCGFGTDTTPDEFHDVQGNIHADGNIDTDLDLIVDDDADIGNTLTVGGASTFNDDMNQTAGNATLTFIYGESHGKDIGLVNIITQGVYENITNISQGHTNGVGFNESGNSEFNIKISGAYKVTGALSFNGAGNTEYHLAMGKNGARDEHCHAQRKIGTGNDVGSASFTCIDDFVLGDEITVMIENIDSTSDADIHSINLNIVRVGN